MSTRDLPCTQDTWLRDIFGAPVDELYDKAAHPDVSLGLAQAMELRSFLALAEEQVARVRDRIHAATAPDADMDDLHADVLRMDTEWMEAALAARDGYRTALANLLSTTPPLGYGTNRPARMTHHRITTDPPAASPTTQQGRAGSVHVAEQRFDSSSGGSARAECSRERTAPRW